MKRIIYALLIIIIISASILIFKINNTPKYDKNLYEKVYHEYDEIKNEVDENVQEHEIKYITKNARDVQQGTYRTIGTIDIPKIKISYPILNEYTEEYLNIAPVKLTGVNPNEIGNCVIIGHNYWSTKFFSNLNKLSNGDIVEITDRSKKKVQYNVSEKYEINESDYSCTKQNDGKNREVTLITCIKYKKNKRLVVKCIENNKSL